MKETLFDNGTNNRDTTIFLGVLALISGAYLFFAPNNLMISPVLLDSWIRTVVWLIFILFLLIGGGFTSTNRICVDKNEKKLFLTKKTLFGLIDSAKEIQFKKIRKIEFEKRLGPKASDICWLNIITKKEEMISIPVDNTWLLTNSDFVKKAKELSKIIDCDFENFVSATDFINGRNRVNLSK